MTVLNKIKLQESGLSEAVPGAPQRRRITIIQAGWGSSGYYSPEVLERDGPRVFPEGTHMYLNHPTSQEDRERPERDVKDLAARIDSTPVMVGDKLEADALIFPIWQPVIDSLAEDIGVSIRAMGASVDGEAEGRSGPIITSLTEGLSVDFVTQAGAGGKIGELIESAKAQVLNLEEVRNAGNWFEARMHSDFTILADDLFGSGHLTREERIGLSTALGDALTAFNASVTDNLPQLYDRDPFDDAMATTAQVEETTTEQEDTEMSDAKLAELEEKLTGLSERVTTVETERDAEKERADRAEDALERVRAEKIVKEAVAEVEGLPERAVDRVIKAAVEGKLPRTEDKELDEPRLKEAAESAAKAELEYLGESLGTGKVRGAGGGKSLQESTEQSKESQERLESSFKRLGMSEETAKAAAVGR